MIIIQVDREIKAFHFVAGYDEFEHIRTEYERLKSNPKRLVVNGQKLLQIVFDPPDVECILKIQDMDSDEEPILEGINVKSLTAEIYSISFLGTKFTMEEDFYVDRLKSHGLKVITPDDEDRDYIHQVIYDELCKGIMRGTLKMAFINIIAKLKERGAEGVILGCTEIPLLIEQEDMVEELADLLLFDTTCLHAEAAARIACEKNIDCFIIKNLEL